MTSTPFSIGLGDNDRRSSRVLRPPGGGHTDIFGADPEPVRGRRPAAACGATSVVSEKNGQANGEEAAITQEPVSSPPAPAVVPEPVITPKTEVAAPPQPAMEPPKRTRVPPGGFSSGLW